MVYRFRLHQITTYISKCIVASENDRLIALTILRLIEQITTYIDQKNNLHSCVYRRRKIIDATYHRFQLIKLEHFVITGVSCNWIKSYLCEWK